MTWLYIYIHMAFVSARDGLIQCTGWDLYRLYLTFTTKMQTHATHAHAHAEVESRHMDIVMSRHATRAELVLML
jgi:hypothetical protein